MADNVFQLKWYCRTGVWPRGAQVRQRCGRSLNPLSSMKTIVRPSFFAFFLTPASVLVSTAESFLHLVPRRVRSVAGNSNPVAAGCARPARGRTSRRIPARSGPPPATKSTGWFHNPVPGGRASDRIPHAAGLPDTSAVCARHAPLSSAPAAPRLAVAGPSDSPIAGAPPPDGPPRPAGHLAATVPPPTGDALPTCENLAALLLGFP